MNRKMTTVFPTYLHGRRINVPVIRQEARCGYSSECEYFNPKGMECYTPQSRKCGINFGLGGLQCLVEIGAEGIKRLSMGEID